MQIQVEFSFATAAAVDEAVVSSGEAAVGLRTAVEVAAVLLAEAQVPGEEGTASSTAALRPEVEA